MRSDKQREDKPRGMKLAEVYKANTHKQSSRMRGWSGRAGERAGGCLIEPWVPNSSPTGKSSPGRQGERFFCGTSSVAVIPSSK